MDSDRRWDARDEVEIAPTFPSQDGDPFVEPIGITLAAEVRRIQLTDKPIGLGDIVHVIQSPKSRLALRRVGRAGKMPG